MPKRYKPRRVKKSDDGVEGALVAIIRDKDHVLIGVDPMEKLDGAIECAKKCGAHCYIPREGNRESLRKIIGRRIEDGWQYYYMFEND